MSELLRLTLGGSGDVAVAGQLARDVSREAGMARLEQTKLATVVSGLARRCLASAGAGEVVFSVDGTQGATRLVVAVSDPDTGSRAAGSSPAATSIARVALGLDLHSLRRLVDNFEQAARPDGSTWVTAAVRLSPEVANDPGLIRRLSALRPRAAPTTAAPRSDDRSVDLSDMLEAQAKVLELTLAELVRVNEEKAAANAELALTNRGVLDLVAELSAANASLTATGAEYRQLADQQSALADLGHRAVASRDIGMLALGLVGILFAIYVWFRTRKGRLPTARWLKITASFAVLFPLLGASAGWIFTEMGRQPWIVFGLQKTADGVSPTLTTFQVGLSLVVFTLLYGGLAVVEIGLLIRAVKIGPPETVELIDADDANSGKTLTFSY